MNWLRLLPVVVLLGLAGTLGYALLTRTNTAQNDRFVGEPVPAFILSAPAGYPGFAPQDLVGDAYILNVWGSWCAPCEVEHPVLMELAREGIPVYGIAWRDSEASATDFLRRLGNPFTGVVLDPFGEAVIELGVTGAPETFVVGSDGIIRARWTGLLTDDVVRRVIRPALDGGA